MFSFAFNAKPDDRHPDKDKILCASVVCYVDRPTIEEAVEVARKRMLEEFFIVGEPRGIQTAVRSDLQEETIGQNLFDRAAVTGQAFEIVTIPCPPNLDESEEDS